jgi:predicted acetyltransferase
MLIMDFEIRTVAEHEAEHFWRLGHEAFGFPTTPSDPGSLDRPGAISVIAMDGDTMAGRMVDSDFDCWFGGRLVPTSGIGGVTVAMEYRGQGLLRPLFTELFRIAKGRGAVLSALYPSSAGIYRSLGYEVIGTADPARFPISALARISAPADIRTRRATVVDVPAIREVYDVWAAANNGPLSRRGASFPPDDENLIKSFTGITVAERDGVIIGYVSWNRGSSFGPDGTLKVFDLIASERDGYRALLAALGSYASIVGWVHVQNASGLDLVLELFPTSEWQVLDSQPYMLKILDVVGALEARGYPAVISTTLEFGVSGDPITGTDGHYRLELADGKAICTRLGDLDPAVSVPVFTPNGLALAYAGSQSSAGIRTVGGLSGPADDDDTFGAIFGGRPVRIRDHY